MFGFSILLIGDGDFAMRMAFDVTKDGRRFISNNNDDWNDVYPYYWLGFSTDHVYDKKSHFRLRNWDAI